MINLLHHIKLPIHHLYLLSGAEGRCYWPPASVSATEQQLSELPPSGSRLLLKTTSREGPDSCSATCDFRRKGNCAELGHGDAAYKIGRAP